MMRPRATALAVAGDVAMRGVVALALILTLSVCTFVPVEGPPAGPFTFRQIFWENHTDEALEMRFTEEENHVAGGLVEPCSPGGMGQPMQNRFDVVLSAPDGELSPVGDWRSWQEAGDQLVVAVIESSGRVRLEFRDGAPSMADKFC
jgi:hypothetical protein